MAGVPAYRGRQEHEVRSVDRARVARAAAFRAMNLAGDLVLPNAWDAVSARIFEAAGFPAVGTTSAGVAYARGFRDAERIGRDGMMREVAVIAGAVDVPVTADVEAGYGPEEADVAATVAGAITAGAVGINLEDRIYDTVAGTGAPGDDGARSGPGPLYGVESAAGRIAAARAEADRAGLPLVINARTDTFLLGLGSDLGERVAMSIFRGRAYLAAGADLVFVPLVLEPTTVREIVTGIGGPVSLMAAPGAPSAADLFAAGARRVSLGGGAMFATLATLRHVAEDILATGEWGSLERDGPEFGFAEAEGLFTGR